MAPNDQENFYLLWLVYSFDTISLTTDITFKVSYFRGFIENLSHLKNCSISYLAMQESFITFGGCSMSAEVVTHKESFAPKVCIEM